MTIRRFSVTCPTNFRRAPVACPSSFRFILDWFFDATTTIFDQIWTNFKLMIHLNSTLTNYDNLVHIFTPMMIFIRTMLNVYVNRGLWDAIPLPRTTPDKHENYHQCVCPSLVELGLNQIFNINKRCRSKSTYQVAGFGGSGLFFLSLAMAAFNSFTFIAPVALIRNTSSQRSARRFKSSEICQQNSKNLLDNC